MTENVSTEAIAAGTIPGEPPGTATYTALDIAKLCGYSSDRWTRDRRAELEKLLASCKNGSALTAALKTNGGNRYTEFALQEIQALQRATSTGIPVLRDGKPVMNKGRAKLETVERQMTLEQYGKVLQERFGKPSDDEELPPEDDPENPGGTDEEIVAELLTEDAEQTSVKIEWVPIAAVGGTSAIEIMDSNGAIAGDTRATFQGLRAKMLQDMRILGKQDGALMARAYILGNQEGLNQGLIDHSHLTETDEPTTPRRTTKRR